MNKNGSDKRLKIPPIVKYRHLRNAKGKLFCTVCTMKALDATAIGVSLCSTKDNFSRKYGRELSKVRADIAMLSKRNTLPMRIVKLKTANEIIEMILEMAEIPKNIVMINSAPPVCDLSNHPERDMLVPHPWKSLYIPIGKEE